MLEVAAPDEKPPRTRDSISGSLITLILGALVLWVGQTTFQHNGIISGVQHEVLAAGQRHQALQKRYDDVVASLNERTRSRFTREDGDKLMLRIKDVESALRLLNERVHEKTSDLSLQIAAVEVRAQAQSQLALTRPERSQQAPTQAAAQRIAQLQGEVERLRRENARLQAAAPRQAPVRTAYQPHASGARFVLIATDPMAAIDVPHFCNEHGHRLLTESREGGELRFEIEKA